MKRYIRTASDAVDPKLVSFADEIAQQYPYKNFSKLRGVDKL